MPTPAGDGGAVMRRLWVVERRFGWDWIPDFALADENHALVFSLVRGRSDLRVKLWVRSAES